MVGRLEGVLPAICAQQAELHSPVCLLQVTVGPSAHQQPVWAGSCSGCLEGTAGVCLLNPVRAASNGQCYSSSASITPTLHAVALLTGYQLRSHPDGCC